MADQYEVECPVKGCTDPLGVSFVGWYTLAPEDMTPRRKGWDAPSPLSVHTASWQIECTAGHVLLLPTEATGCRVEDETDQPCPHTADVHDSDDYRTLRAGDLMRLGALIDTLATAP